MHLTAPSVRESVFVQNGRSFGKYDCWTICLSFKVVEECQNTRNRRMFVKILKGKLSPAASHTSIWVCLHRIYEDTYLLFRGRERLSREWGKDMQQRATRGIEPGPAPTGLYSLCAWVTCPTQWDTESWHLLTTCQWCRAWFRTCIENMYS